MKTSVLTLAAALMVITLTACGGYYRVVDPTTEKVYYTKDIESGKSGAVKFEDAKTEKDITLQNSEVEKITKDEFKVNTMTRDEKTE